MVKIIYETKKIPKSLSMTLDEFTKTTGYRLESLIAGLELEFKLDGWHTTVYDTDSVEFTYEGKVFDPKKMKLLITPNLEDDPFENIWGKVDKDE